MLVPELTDLDLAQPLDLKTILNGKMAQCAYINLLNLKEDCKVGKKGDLQCCLTLVYDGKPVSLIYPPERMSALAMGLLLKIEEATNDGQKQ